ncbi:nSTAND1 domain-containing NTPase [Candidatus Entotheonella palauensis]|uniref:nSTAND1 domain-containing NTPase n=1 Tax=Candidatus Entotheonella palauensis TaxID=93172 RepID=UPI000B802AB2|nr:PDZ domain-containing protein [Candidatus Entotheonella palauensis]
MNTAAIALPSNPFPGLRPFREDEEYLFFGRERQVDVMVNTLASTHFLAVVGNSGSGKSSLVNCGLCPALRRGLMARAGTAWRIAQFRPGAQPLQAMARALAQDGVLFRDYEPGGLTLDEIFHVTLSMSELGLADIYEQARLGAHVNLLVVVDQFEELFRYQQLGASPRENVYRISEEAIAFVNLLLHARAQAIYPIYVVLTMRSDFLGDCTQFTGLAEAINAGQYLVPRMTRDERRATILGPIGVSEANIASVLLTRLVNDVGDNPDQLSILQHALSRTWSYWRHESGGRESLDLAHYEAIGTMAHALDQHAEQAYTELDNAGQQRICERIFKALTDKATDARGVRRPTTLGTLCAVAEAAEPEVAEVLDGFRQPSRSFVMPPAGERLEADTVIDISHESLMRVWGRLKVWADEEAQSAQMYRRLAETAVLHEEGRAGLWRDPDLEMTLQWDERNRPNAVWAQRYHPEFASATRFLEASRAARDAEIQAAEAQRQAQLAAEQRAARHWRLLAAGLVVLTMLIAALGIFALQQSRRAEAQRRIAETQRTKALARQLAAQSRMALGNQAGDPIRSALLATESLRQAHTLQGYLAWKDAFALLPKQQMLLPHDDAVITMALSPDGVLAATVSQDGKARLWETASGRERLILSEEKAHLGIEYQPLATDIAARLGILNGVGVEVVSVIPDTAAETAGMQAGDLIVRLNGEAFHHTPWLAGIPPDSPAIFEILRNDHPMTLTVTLGRTEAAAPIQVIDISPDGRRLASMGPDHTARLWAVDTGEELARMPHSQPLTAVVFSPDSHHLATADQGGTVRLFAVDTDREVSRMAHATAVAAMTFSFDGSLLATADAEHTARIWHTASGQEVVSDMRHDGEIKALTLSPDGRRLATASFDGTARLWDTASGRELYRMAHHHVVWSVSFSPDGQHLATAGFDHTVRVWDTANGQEVVSPMRHAAEVRSVAFSPDGRRLATASDDRTARLWDAASGRELSRMAHDDRVQTVAFSPAGTHLVTAAHDGTARLWLVDTVPERRRFDHPSEVRAIAFRSERDQLITASHDRTVRLWAVDSGRVIAGLAHDAPVDSAVFNLAHDWVATLSGNHTVRLWDISAVRELMRLPHVDRVRGIALSPDDRWLATASGHAARLWEVATGKESEQSVGHDDRVWSVRFSPDSRYVVTVSDDHSAKLWEVGTARKPARLAHEHAVIASAFSSDSSRLATGSGQANPRRGAARIWEPSSGRQLAYFHHEAVVSVLAFSPSGNTLATADSDGVVQLWELASGQISTRFAHDAAISMMAFNAAGDRLATASRDGTARVWDMEMGQELVRVMHDEHKPVNAVAFSPGVEHLVTASDDGTVRVWRWRTQELIDAACVRLTRNLTRQEWRQYLGTEPYRPSCPGLLGFRE